MSSTDTPRIYVACLACYNEGRLRGVWIDADQDPDAIDQERKDLQEECGHTDNDWAIHDFEGFQGLKIGEYEPFENVSKLAGLIEEHGEPFAIWYGNESRNASDDLDKMFRESYQGEWKDEGDYAAQMFEDCGMLENVPENIQPYIDFDAIARDMRYNGEIWSAPGSAFKVYIFRND